LVVTNLRGDIFFVKNEVVGAENILTTLEACIGEALSRWDLQAIGIASSGIVEARRGFSIRSPRRKDMDNVPLRELYEQKFGLPVYVDDVSRSAAFAEWQLGILQGERCFLYLFLDEGVGLAWLVDGVFYYGPFGIAGEVGHCVIEENGSLCGCGNRGCLETFASTEAIVRKVQEALRLGVVSSLAGQEVSMVSIIREAERGDKLCYSLLTEAGEYVGKAMAQVVNLTGIPLIVLGGQLCKAKEFITEPIIRMVRANALAFLGDRLEIRIAMLDEYAGAMGVAMQALSEVLGRVAKG
ncbi:MAG: ROK family protein, partial [Candidatus Caldatribacterium sp.]|nr:ROK family protein [Candidatus Caldatribacterium sp.]